MTEQKNSFPVMSIKYWWLLREQFNRSIPSTINKTSLSSLFHMSESSAQTNILPTLRMVDIIDQDGNVNSELVKKLRDDQLYQNVCDEIKSKVYPKELLELFDADSDNESVKRWFANHTGAGSAAVSRMAKFYLMLCEADLSKGKDIPKPSHKSSKKSTKKESPTSIKKSVMNADSEGSTQESKVYNVFPDPKFQYPALNINIQIHISSDATTDQIDQIFSSMSKHLYNKIKNN